MMNNRLITEKINVKNKGEEKGPPDATECNFMIYSPESDFKIDVKINI